MSVPFFYISQYDGQQTKIELDEDTSRHVVQVLRMKKNEVLNLTDGQGNLFKTEIIDDHRKHCIVSVTEKSFYPREEKKLCIAISLLKNPARFEWFLEKATEVGVNEIIPLLCARTEKEKFRHDRLQQILISAMLQSQQCWLPILHMPIAYTLLFRQEEVMHIEEKYIAHCVDDTKQSVTNQLKPSSKSRMMLIGPEGDFTEEEIALAIANHFTPVALGENRLRTETAGIVAATLLRLV